MSSPSSLSDMAHGTLSRLSGWGSMRSFSLSWPDLWALGFVAWAGLSLLWSGDPWEGLGRWQNFVALLIVFLWARRADLSWLPGAASVAGLGVMVLHLQWPQFYHWLTMRPMFQTDHSLPHQTCRFPVVSRMSHCIGRLGRRLAQCLDCHQIRSRQLRQCCHPLITPHLDQSIQ